MIFRALSGACSAFRFVFSYMSWPKSAANLGWLEPKLITTLLVKYRLFYFIFYPLCLSHVTFRINENAAFF